MPNGTHTIHVFKQRWPGADTLRAVAMLAVFLGHALTAYYGTRFNALVEILRSGTDVFLLLSGWLIYKSLQRKAPPYVEFLKRRFLRIYPVYVCILALYLCVLYPAFQARSKLPADIREAALTILQNVTVLPLAFNGVTRIIAASWTLGNVCMFYLLAHPLASLTRALPRGRRVAIWAALSITVYLVAGRPFLLALGAVLCEIAPQISLRPIWLVLCSGVLLRGMPNASMLGLLASAMGVSTLFLWALKWRSTPKPAAFLSRISYSFYLTHGLAIVLVEHMSLPPALAVLVSFGAAVAASVAVYTVVEQRFSPLAASKAGRLEPRMPVRARAA